MAVFLLVGLSLSSFLKGMFTQTHLETFFGFWDLPLKCPRHPSDTTHVNGILFMIVIALKTKKSLCPESGSRTDGKKQSPWKLLTARSVDYLDQRGYWFWKEMLPMISFVIVNVSTTNKMNWLSLYWSGGRVLRGGYLTTFSSYLTHVFFKGVAAVAHRIL